MTRYETQDWRGEHLIRTATVTADPEQIDRMGEIAKRRNKVRECHGRGMTASDMSRVLCVDKATIYKDAKKLGLTLRSGKGNPADGKP
ncbi:hypothetical protein [Ruegeria lacuscaerulensis]|uniref:hypothetical protein n=1 Tax=Ruegeria lacuscaerulensis TaxID=55218 RepID=UPI00147DE271|nr:hypothetical protein [Ruegeria lacuscaerulensis]